MKGIQEKILVGGDGLNLWFEAKMKKYSNSAMQEHLMAIWMMMTGETVQDDSLETFFENEFSN